MTHNNTPREQKRIREVAKEYENKGFAVSVEPSGAALPAFLREASYSPDIIATSGKETHVIEVSSKDTAARLRQLSKVVEKIEAKPGWRFVLVMTNPRITTRDLSSSEIPRLEDLQKALVLVLALEKASLKANANFSQAVLLTAWAIVEGALRMYLFSNRSKVPSGSPHSIVRDAVTYGFINRSEGEFLDSVAKIRNAVAHGAVNIKTPSDKLERLLSLCRSLVGSIDKPAKASS